MIADTNKVLDELTAIFGEEAMAVALAEINKRENHERLMHRLNTARLAEANRPVTDRAAGASGLRLDFEVPMGDYHFWAAEFKRRDELAGIRDTTGYECWRDPEFIAEYKRDNPTSVVVNEKRTNRIVVPASKYEPVLMTA